MFISSIPPPECFQELTSLEEQDFYRNEKERFEEYLEWKEIIQVEEKKKLMLNFLHCHLNFIDDRVKWVLKLYTPTSTDMGLENDFIILELLEQIKIKLTKE